MDALANGEAIFVSTKKDNIDNAKRLFQILEANLIILDEKEVSNCILFCSRN